MNTSFNQFAEKIGLKLEDTHGMFQCNEDAMYKSIAKYSRPEPIFDKVALALAVDYCSRHFVSFLAGSEEISLEEAKQQFDLATSCGYPWSLKYHNKRELVSEPWFDTMAENFYKSLNESEDSMVPIWTVAQKREIRSKEKLDANKVRTFTAAPIELLVSSNRLLLQMNENFYKAAGYTWSMVGSTKYLRGWHEMIMRLRKHPNCFELDETNYDASCAETLMKAVRDLRKDWGSFNEEQKQRIDSIYNHLIYSVMVLENGWLIRKSRGNPSGSPNTVVDNTLILFIYFAYAWIILAQESGHPEMLAYATFIQHVEAALYGDDNTFSVSDAAVGWFNAKSVIEVWSRIGIETTTPTLLARPAELCDFLSQGARWDDTYQLYLPTPHLDKIIASLRYGTEHDDVRWHFLRACHLRLDSWGSLECRSLVERYIKFLLFTYRDQFVGSINGISVEEIMATYKSDRFLACLYTGGL